MERVSLKQLEAVVEQINKATNNPVQAWVRNGDGKIHAQIGNYHLDEAYGGVGLVQMVNDGGGVRSIIGGFRPKRELFYLLRAYLDGVRGGKEVQP